MYAEPVTVVEDTGDRLVVFTKSGTPTKWSWVDWGTGEFDGPRDHVWSRTDVLKILEVDKGYAIWLMWEENGGLSCNGTSTCRRRSNTEFCRDVGSFARHRDCPGPAMAVEG